MEIVLDGPQFEKSQWEQNYLSKPKYRKHQPITEKGRWRRKLCPTLQFGVSLKHWLWTDAVGKDMLWRYDKKKKKKKKKIVKNLKYLIQR